MSSLTGTCWELRASRRSTSPPGVCSYLGLGKGSCLCQGMNDSGRMWQVTKSLGQVGQTPFCRRELPASLLASSISALVPGGLLEWGPLWLSLVKNSSPTLRAEYREPWGTRHGDDGTSPPGEAALTRASRMSGLKMGPTDGALEIKYFSAFGG